MQFEGQAVVLAIIAAAITIWLVVQLRRGVSYSVRPAMRVTRTADPFLFWLLIATQSAKLTWTILNCVFLIVGMVAKVFARAGVIAAAVERRR